MRDIESDRQSGKTTPATRLGFERSKTLHRLLLTTALICYAALAPQIPSGLFWLTALPLAATHLHRLQTATNPAAVGRELPHIVRFALAVNLLFGSGLLIDSLIAI